MQNEICLGNDDIVYSCLKKARLGKQYLQKVPGARVIPINIASLHVK